VAERDADRENLRPSLSRYPIDVAYQLREEVVGIQFLDDELQEDSGPTKVRRACGEQSQHARTDFFTPAQRIELLFRADCLFQQAVDVGFAMDLAHSCTSTTRDTRNGTTRVENCGGPGPPARLRCVRERTARGCARTGTDEG
jgi:hypothetical protein